MHPWSGSAPCQVEIHWSTTHLVGRPSHRVAQRRRRTPVCFFTAATLVVALLPIEVVRAAESPLVSQSFANNSVPVGQWTLPALQSGTNGACLSAGSAGASTSDPCARRRPTHRAMAHSDSPTIV